MPGILNLILGGVGVVKDAYFNLVSLLLPGNGTNGAQNNTFLDSSTNNFTITRNGNTTQGTFSPFSQTGWGNYFDGSGDYLSVSSNAAFGFGTGDFTIEYWIYPSLTGDGNQVVIDARSSSSAIPWLIGQTTGGAVRYYDGTTIRTGGTMTANTWNHVAWCRASNVNNVYLNGTSVSTYTASQDFGSSNPLTLGSNINTATERTTGYISNLRIVKGTAVYTANFTPPTTPLTAISGTSLLTCQSNRFKDNSSNAFTITSSGGPTVVAFSPFAPTAAYTTAAVGGSGYFDGTGDSLSLPTNASFAMGTGDFTIEFWLYTSNVATNGYVIQTDTVAATNSLFISFGSSTLRLTNGVTVFATTPTLVVNTWYHIAVVRSGTSSVIYTNGVAGTAVTCTANFTQNTGGIGPSNYIGYLSNLRFVKGVAVYTGSFTPPTGQLATSGAASAASYPSTTNVDTSFASSACSLLLNFTNAGITDATAKNDLETVGNAQISTSVSKFGGGSIYLDGSSSYLRAQSNAGPSAMSMMFGTGPYTIEMWVYQTSRNSNGAYLISNQQLQANITSTGTVNVNLAGGSNYATTTTTVPLSTWTYIAFVRTSTSANGFKIYINGVDSATGTDSTNYSSAAQINIGTTASGNSLYVLTGYIDDLRITNYARTISASPSAPFPVQ